MDNNKEKDPLGKDIKPAKNNQKAKIIINPPEKKPQDYNEGFRSALAKHSVIIEKKIQLILQSKAERSDLPEETLKQVFIRGYRDLPLNTSLTREQHAMNRVNSFIAHGQAFREDHDLIPIDERMGLKGTGGAARPHIQREKSPYSDRVVYHVVDAKGVIKHSTSDEFEAKKHLAQKYNDYLGESKDSPSKRLEGTASLVKKYKKDTPGESVQEQAKKLKGKDPCWNNYKMVGLKPNGDPNCVGPVKEQADQINERFKTAAWSRKEGKNPEGGLNRKGIASYRARNPGSKLSMAVTTPPSKLDPDSKSAKRRKSFCARMSGVDGPMKKPNGEPTRKALALRKWNC